MRVQSADRLGVFMCATATILLFALSTLALAQEGSSTEAATPEAGEVSVGDEAPAEGEVVEPAGPVIVELEGDLNVVLLPGAWLYTAPSVEAARARWSPAVTGSAAQLAAAEVAGAEAESGDFVRIGTPATGHRSCAESFTTSFIDVDLWVSRASLGQAVVAPVTLPGGDDTELTLNAGVLVAPQEDGTHLMRTWSTEISATLPPESVGARFTRAEPLERLDANAGLPTDATIRAADGSFEVRVPKGLHGNVGVVKHEASAAGTELSMSSSCVSVRGLTQDAVGMKPEGTGGLITGFDYGGVEDHLVVAGEAALSWGDGSEAGRTTMDWWVDEAEVRAAGDGRSCTSWSPSGGASLGPEGLLTLCWSSEDDQTFAERQAAAGPPPEPIVLPKRAPPKRAKLQGVAMPMDVEAHLAVDIAPAFTDQGPDKTQEYLKSAMVGKVKGLQQLEKHFSEQMIENPDDPDMVVMFAILYEDMAASLLDAWVPPELDAEQQLVYRDELASRALPQCDKAFELYVLAGERARPASVPPRSLKTVSEALDRLRPDDRTSEQDRMEACFRAYDW